MIVPLSGRNHSFLAIFKGSGFHGSIFFIIWAHLNFRGFLCIECLFYSKGYTSVNKKLIKY